MRRDIVEEARDILKSVGERMDMSWRDVNKVTSLMNTLVAGYSIALEKVLGNYAGAMTQLLLTEVGDVLSAMVDEILGCEQLSYESENRTVLIEKALKELGIAKDVKVISETSDEHEKHKILIKDSIFYPVHRILVDRGLREFPLSPEGLLCAAIARRVLREKKGGDVKSRVVVNTLLPVEDRTLIIEIKQVKGCSRT
ncbi:hypothetical protein [Archaeoglobus sp.]